MAFIAKVRSWRRIYLFQGRNWVWWIAFPTWSCLCGSSILRPACRTDRRRCCVCRCRLTRRCLSLTLSTSSPNSKPLFSSSPAKLATVPSQVLAPLSAYIGLYHPTCYRLGVITTKRHYRTIVLLTGSSSNSQQWRVGLVFARSVSDLSAVRILS